MESTFTKGVASTGVRSSADPVPAEPRPRGAGACVASDTIEYLALYFNLLSQLERHVASESMYVTRTEQRHATDRHSRDCPPSADMSLRVIPDHVPLRLTGADRLVRAEGVHRGGSGQVGGVVIIIPVHDLR